MSPVQKMYKKWIIPYIVGFKLSGMLHAAGSCTYILAFFESILEKKQNHGAALGMEPFPVTFLNSAIAIIMVYHDNHCRHGGGGGHSHKLLLRVTPTLRH